MIFWGKDNFLKKVFLPIWLCQITSPHLFKNFYTGLNLVLLESVMTATVLKIIAAVTMFIDHAGLILFPQYRIFRIIGRLAFPIYAYCIAEGFRYTKNRKKYFLRVFILGVLCQIVYTVVERDLYIGILLTFSLSIGLMALADRFLAERREGKIGWGILFFPAVIAVYLLTHYVEVDYGFFGVMLPVFTSFFEDKPRRLVMFGAGLVAVSMEQFFLGSMTQFYSLLAIIPVCLYNGKQGKYKLKNFFYIFYPAHMVFLYAVDFLLQR